MYCIYQITQVKFEVDDETLQGASDGKYQKVFFSKCCKLRGQSLEPLRQRGELEARSPPPPPLPGNVFLLKYSFYLCQTQHRHGMHVINACVCASYLNLPNAVEALKPHGFIGAIRFHIKKLGIEKFSLSKPFS